MYQALANAVLNWAMPKVPNSQYMKQQFDQMVQSGYTPAQLMNGLEEMARQNNMHSAFEQVPSWSAMKNKNPNANEVEPFVQSTLSEMGILNKVISYFIGGNR